MTQYIERSLENDIKEFLQIFPVTTILGPRQCGKSTLARKIVRSFPHAVFLDLEDATDRQKLADPKLFFETNKNKLVCIDEIQLTPTLFSVLRTIIDERGENGQLLVLGSASRDLIRQSSESLAGRIGYLELTPFLAPEVPEYETSNLWLRGGFPRSLLASSERASFLWRKNFIQTYLERDIPALGFDIPAQMLKRLWTMIAHSSGSILNSSKLGTSLGVSHTTLRKYIDLLSQTFMVRLLEPLEANVKKRLVKSPKIYIRDSGVLHTLLDIENKNDLLGNPILGNSWETFVVEQIITQFPDWKPTFYRTAAGAEMDLVLSRGNKRIGIEIKAASTPKVTKGFWSAIEDLKLEKTWIISPIHESYFIREDVRVSSLEEFLRVHQN
jgi:predicted AAA+ superfamily ATPase